MTTSASNRDWAALWGDARMLHPLYVSLAQEFVLEAPPCAELEAPVDSPEQEIVEAACRWLEEMDRRIAVHQLRQFLQTTALANGETLRAMLAHHLAKSQRDEADRDKVDFLLVQYFASQAPSPLKESDVSLAYVGQLMQPILGAVGPNAPAWLQAIDSLLQTAQRCVSLNDLLTHGVLEQGRKLKAQAADNYFQPVAMVAFLRFSFLMRRIFFRLMHEDLNAILDGLKELERRGVESIDCRQAQFSEQEPVIRLRMICQSWKVLFHAEYSSGQPLRMLVDLRASVSRALESEGNQGFRPQAVKAGAPQARAAVAGAGSASGRVPSVQASEFEVSAPSESWSADAPFAVDDDGAV